MKFLFDEICDFQKAYHRDFGEKINEQEAEEICIRLMKMMKNRIYSE